MDAIMENNMNQSEMHRSCPYYRGTQKHLSQRLKILSIPKAAIARNQDVKRNTANAFKQDQNVGSIANVNNAKIVDKAIKTGEQMEIV